MPGAIRPRRISARLLARPPSHGNASQPSRPHDGRPRRKRRRQRGSDYDQDRERGRPAGQAGGVLATAPTTPSARALRRGARANAVARRARPQRVKTPAAAPTTRTSSRPSRMGIEVRPATACGLRGRELALSVSRKSVVDGSAAHGASAMEHAHGAARPPPPGAGRCCAIAEPRTIWARSAERRRRSGDDAARR